MQEEILHLLGLNYRPQAAPKRRTISSANSTVPTFMKVKYVFVKRMLSGGVVYYTIKNSGGVESIYSTSDILLNE